MPQKTFAQQIFCTVADVRTKISSPEVVIVANKSDKTLDSQIQSHIDSSKDQYLRQPLINECTKRFPTTVQGWLEYKRMQINVSQIGLRRDLQQSFSLSGSDTAWYQDEIGTFIDIGGLLTGSVMGVMPRTFYNYGVPTNGANGTLVNIASNGAICLDTSPTGWLLYINRSIDPTQVLWQLYDPSDAIDFILNPQELKWSAIWGCALSMAQDGMLRNTFNFDNPQEAAFKSHILNFCMKQYQNALWGFRDELTGARISQGALSIIQWDLSGDGAISDFERSVNTNEFVFGG